MSEKDWWSRWFRTRPFFRTNFLSDIDEVFKEMEEMMEKELQNLSRRVPENRFPQENLSQIQVLKNWWEGKNKRGQFLPNDICREK